MNSHDSMSPLMVAMVGIFIDDVPDQTDEIDVEGLM